MSHTRPQHFTARTRRVSARFTRRTVYMGLILGSALLGLSTWAITLGSYSLSASDLLAVLTRQEDGMLHTVVMEWRLPRIIAAILFGGLLGISGAIFQSLTRNPLGSPDIIGFNSGAFSGVILALAMGATSYVFLTVGAVVGGLATATLVYFTSFRRGVSGFRFIIVGIAVGAFLSSLNSWFTVTVDVDTALRAAVWGAGSLGLVSWNTLAVSAVISLAVVMSLPLAQRLLVQLELGDETAAGLGVPTEKAKAGLILLGTLTTAAVTASAGPIAFVALAAPHIARRLAGKGSSVDLVSSALVGALLLVLSDITAQHAIPGAVLPVGAVTVCLGGGYLIYLLVAESRRSSA